MKAIIGISYSGEHSKRFPLKELKIENDKNYSTLIIPLRKLKDFIFSRPTLTKLAELRSSPETNKNPTNLFVKAAIIAAVPPFISDVTVVVLHA
jgi:hypothetical protein